MPFNRSPGPPWGPPGTTIANWKLIQFTPGAPYVAALNKIAADCAA